MWYSEGHGLSPYSHVKDIRKCDRQADPFDIWGGSAGSRMGTSKLTLQESLVHLRWRYCTLCSLCRIYDKMMWDLYICGNKACSLEVISKCASNPSLCPDNFIFNNSHISSFISVFISSSDHHQPFFSDWWNIIPPPLLRSSSGHRKHSIQENEDWLCIQTSLD